MRTLFKQAQYASIFDSSILAIPLFTGIFFCYPQRVSLCGQLPLFVWNKVVLYYYRHT